MTLARLFMPALLLLLGACAGPSSQLAPLSPGPGEPGRALQPGVDLGSAVGDSSAAGYMGYGPSDELASEPADTSERALSDWAITMMRSVELRRAVDDVQRLRILDDLQEARPGELSGIVGPGFGISSTGYNLARLLRAYKSTVEWDPDAALILWRGDRKIGSFDDSGLTLLRRQ